MKHSHNHAEHSSHCGENCKGHHCHHTPPTEAERELLKHLEESQCLAVVRFILNSTKSDHLRAVALEPVHLTNADDTMPQVKEKGKLLKELESKGLITIDYNNKETDEQYEMYLSSSVYRLFQETVIEAKARPEFIYNIGKLECGTIKLNSK